MITLMVGRPIDQLYPDAPVAAAVARAALGRGARRDRRHPAMSSFTLHSGEVLGIFGLMGSGRTELARILFGLDAFDERRDRRRRPAALDDPSPRAQHPQRHRLRHREPPRGGPSDERLDRRQHHARRAAEIRRDAGRIHRAATRLRGGGRDSGRGLRIKAASLDSPAKSLSGGNQQKVVLAKWLMSRAGDLHHGRADARHRRRRQVRDLRDHRPARGRRRRRALHLLRARGAARHLRPHPGDEPRRDRRRIRAQRVRPRKPSLRAAFREQGAAA